MIESRSAASLTGKVVLITGGTSGLGRWTTRIVAERDAPFGDYSARTRKK